MIAFAALTILSTWTDPATGKAWHELAHSVTWADAAAGCAASSYRLPTLDEWWDAYDRIKGTELTQRLMTLQLKAWTADQMPGTEPERFWAVYLQSGNGGGVLATDQASAACLEDPAPTR